jgi:hypothetical protein
VKKLVFALSLALWPPLTPLWHFGKANWDLKLLKSSHWCCFVVYNMLACSGGLCTSVKEDLQISKKSPRPMRIFKIMGRHLSEAPLPAKPSYVAPAAIEFDLLSKHFPTRWLITVGGPPGWEILKRGVSGAWVFAACFFFLV